MCVFVCLSVHCYNVCGEAVWKYLSHALVRSSHCLFVCLCVNCLCSGDVEGVEKFQKRLVSVTTTCTC